MKNYIYLFLLIFSINPVFSQSWEVIPYEDITDETTRIVSLFQDNEGDVWGGNSFAGRVIRWDGTDWEVIPGSVNGMTFESPTIYSIFQDSNNRILFCSSDGVGVYENGEWSNINTSNSDIPYNFTYKVIEHDGVLWFGTRASIASLEGTTWTWYEIPDASWNVLDLAAMDDGRIWVTLANGDAIRRFDNGAWETFSTDNSEVNSNFQYYVEKAADQTFWFGGPSGKGNLYENGTFTPSQNLSNWGMGSDYFTDIVVANGRDDSYFGSGYGLHHLDGDNWETFDSSNSPMTNSEVQAVMIAQDGKIWFSTRNEIVIYTPLTTATDDIANRSIDLDLLPNPVTNLLKINLSNFINLPTTNAEISIVDLHGKTVQRHNTEGQNSINMDVSTLVAGTYLLAYTDGKNRITKRFVKQ